MTSDSETRREMSYSRPSWMTQPGRNSEHTGQEYRLAIQKYGQSEWTHEYYWTAIEARQAKSRYPLGFRVLYQFWHAKEQIWIG